MVSLRVCALGLILLAGCVQAKSDVWSEYADATHVVRYEEELLNDIRRNTAEDPSEENKALLKKANDRFDAALEHLSEVRSRIR